MKIKQLWLKHHMVSQIFFELDKESGRVVYCPPVYSISSLNRSENRFLQAALDDFDGTITVGGRKITNLCYVDDIVLIAGSMNELKELTKMCIWPTTNPGFILIHEKQK